MIFDLLVIRLHQSSSASKLLNRLALWYFRLMQKLGLSNAMEVQILATLVDDQIGSSSSSREWGHISTSPLHFYDLYYVKIINSIEACIVALFLDFYFGGRKSTSEALWLRSNMDIRYNGQKSEWTSLLNYTMTHHLYPANIFALGLDFAKEWWVCSYETGGSVKLYVHCTHYCPFCASLMVDILLWFAGKRPNDVQTGGVSFARYWRSSSVYVWKVKRQVRNPLMHIQCRCWSSDGLCRPQFILLNLRVVATGNPGAALEV